MEALVVAVMRCGPQPWRALETLTDIVGEALWANGRGNLSDRMAEAGLSGLWVRVASDEIDCS